MIPDSFKKTVSSSPWGTVQRQFGHIHFRYQARDVYNVYFALAEFLLENWGQRNELSFLRSFCQSWNQQRFNFIFDLSYIRSPKTRHFVLKIYYFFKLSQWNIQFLNTIFCSKYIFSIIPSMWPLSKSGFSMLPQVPAFEIKNAFSKLESLTFASKSSFHFILSDKSPFRISILHLDFSESFASWSHGTAPLLLWSKSNDFSSSRLRNSLAIALP